ncbi:MAG: TIR domain-containing protein [Flavobacteriaceae bacterium]|nr:TIR domain-containing protein [Flavobacteriaceae bacterium]
MMFSKEYITAQSSTKSETRKDYYKWAIWIESGDSDISEIESVVYLLHSTFKNRVRKITDLTTNFKLESSGWGEFRVEITITKKSGEELQLAHWLSLGNEDLNVIERGVLEEETPKKVYISYSKIDTRTAQLLETMLTDLGMDVASGSDIEPGVPIQDYIEESITEADAVITINSGQENDWQKAELKIAAQLAKTIIPIDTILKGKDEKSVFNSRFYSDRDYGENLKSLGSQIKKLKL